MRDNPTVLGNKEYAPYYAAGTNDAAHLWGCCGLFIETLATQITQDTTRLEAENAVIANATVTAKGEDTAVSGESYLAGMTESGSWWNNQLCRLYIEFPKLLITSSILLTSAQQQQ